MLQIKRKGIIFKSLKAVFSNLSLVTYPSKKLCHIVFILILFLCSCQSKGTESETVLQINDQEISHKDFLYALKTYTYRQGITAISEKDQADFLKTLIERECLIQEAVKERLSEKEEFIRQIENYWKQTLIANLLKKKSNELKKMVFLTTEDIEEGYKRFALKGKYQAYEIENREEGEKMIAKVKKGEKSDFGPVYSFDNGFELTRSFYMFICKLHPGELAIYKSSRGWQIIKLVQKESRDFLDRKEVEKQVERYLRAEKEEQLLKEWIQGLVAKAKIKIYKEKLPFYKDRIESPQKK